MAVGSQPATPPNRVPREAAAGAEVAGPAASRRAFGRELRRWREFRGLSQAELGNLVHCDKSVISRIEAGQRPVSPNFIASCERELATGGALLAQAPAPKENRAAQPVSLAELGLPPSPRLVGRAAQLARILAVLAGDPAQRNSAQICMIRGMPGVGKTALALHAAHQLMSVFTDGCVYRDLGGDTTGVSPTRPEDLLEWLLRHLQVDAKAIPVGLADRAALYRGRTRGKRILLVLDNVRHSDQVMSVLPSEAGCAVIVNTRHRLASVDAAVHIDLNPLTHADARDLLLQTATPNAAPGQPAAEEVEQIVERCGNLPLAIHIAASMYRRKPHLGYRGVLEQLTTHAEGIATFSDGDRSVAAVLRTALAELGDSERRLFRLLSVHPGRRYTPEVAAALAGTTVRVGRQRLDALWDRHLLLAGDGEGYGIHDLLRELSADEATALSEAERGAALRRVLALYLRTADAADALIAPHRNRVPLPGDIGDDVVARFADPAAALEWLDAEEPALVALARAARAYRHDEYGCHLAHILRGYFFHTRRCDPWITTHEDALACARRSGDRWWEATTSNNLGLAFAMRNDLDRACEQYRHALALLTELGDDIGASHTRGHQAWIHYLRGQYTEAVEQARAALAVYQQHGMRRNAAIMMREIGCSLAALNQAGEAAEHLEPAIAEFASLGLDLDMSMALNCLGEIRLRGDPADASARFGAARRKARACGSRIEEVRALRGLGSAAALRGRSKHARGYWLSALTLMEQFQLPGSDEVRRLVADHATGAVHTDGVRIK
ncbi:helix-turn-helix domain-containing protein [Nocardia niwae]|uniref:helix-turn-helix domain-containing protein n=1 Tax=Nocardia niwae TaxID=626084 RepID=UPI0007A41E1B|nr:helix-turn-helix domain-containing protein [Nocardia niwae]